ncbi:MAG: ABC transporter permease [Acidobacteriota bacterium]
MKALAWIVRMAWRDLRASWKYLALAVLVVLVGVAAVVSVRWFTKDLEAALDRESRFLLGADAQVRSRRPLPPELLAELAASGAETTEEVSFASMAQFSSTGATRLVQVRALAGRYPLLGNLETDPPGAYSRLSEGAYALVDRVLLLQFGVAVGDVVRLGRTEFVIAGALERVPGEVAAVSELAPRVFIPLGYLPATGLIQFGSRVGYAVHAVFPESERAARLEDLESLEDKYPEVRVVTAEERRDSFRRQFRNLERFLGLAGLLAFILAGCAVGGSLVLYARRSAPLVAILRCLGSTGWRAVGIFAVQVGAALAIGTGGGVVLGRLVLRTMPVVLAAWLPVDLEPRWRWGPLLEILVLGSGAVAFFALIPMSALRRVSPLAVLRSAVEPVSGKLRLPVLLAGGVLVALFLWSLRITGDAAFAAGFMLGVLVLMGGLWLATRLATAAARRVADRIGAYEWRQGIRNLYRPGNQTTLMVFSVGFAVFLVLLLVTLQQSLLREIELSGSQGRPNLVIFDIQPDEVASVRRIAEEQGMEVQDLVPVVTMRLQAVNGVPVEELAEDRDRGRWALRREYRSTYRDALDESETILRGGVQKLVDGTPEVTLEEGIAGALRVDVGDQLTFDVQGVPLSVRVGGIRRVAWRTSQPNFFVVFPSGVLESAPQFLVLVGRVQDDATSARVQGAVLAAHPTVSCIDLTLVLNTVQELMDKVGFALRFMASFTIAVGLLTLGAALLSGRMARLREILLLRTLGASKRQLHRVLLSEYLFLGILGSLTGAAAACLVSWGLCRWVLDVAFTPGGSAVFWFLSVPVITVLLGMAGSWGTTKQPPLELLRIEA